MTVSENSAAVALACFGKTQESMGRVAATNAGWVAGRQIAQMAVGALIGA